MLKNRAFSVVIVVALLVMASLVVFQASATVKVAAASADLSVSASEPMRADSCTLAATGASSIRATYMREMGLWLPRTACGFTGVDGGLMELLRRRTQ